MMVLVDTSVWIDFFSSKPYPHVNTLENLIFNREDLCLCGVVLTEVLQGIREDSEFKHTRDLLTNLLLLPMKYSILLRSAEIHRTLRKKCITIKRPVDCMIAAVAIENDIPLLHNDTYFVPIEKYVALKTLS